MIERDDTPDHDPIMLDTGQTEGFFNVGPDKAIDNNPKQQFSTGQTAAAVIAKDNFVSNNVYKISDTLLTAYEQLTYDGIEGYDALSDTERLKYEPKYWGIIGDSKSPWQAGRKVLKAQQEEAFNKVIENGTITGVLAGGLYNGVLDPTNIIPVMRAAKSPKFLESFGKAIATNTPSILAGAAVGEANLYWAQETRGVEESINNTIAATIFGGVVAGTLGGIGAKYETGIKLYGEKLYNKIIGDTVDGKDVKTLVGVSGEVEGISILHGDSVGAAKSREDFQLEDLKILGTENPYSLKNPLSLFNPAKPAFWLGGEIFRNPVIRGLQSESVTTARTINEMLEHNFELVGSAKNNKQQPVKLQSLINQYSAKGTLYQLDVVNHYYKQLGLDESGNYVKNAAMSLTKKDKSGYLSFDDFMLKASIAITEGGIDSEYPTVAKLALHTIDTVLTPMTDQLVGLNIVPKNFTPFGASQHLRRVYDQQGILGDITNKKAKLAEKYDEYNKMVINYNKPLDEMKEDLIRLKELNGDAKQINRLEKKVKAENKRIRDGMLKGEYPPELLIGDRGMDFDQIKQLKSLRKPIRKASLDVKHAEEDLKVYKREFNKDRKAFEKNNVPDEKQIGLQKTLDDAKEKLKSIRDDYDARVKNKELDASLFFKTSQDNFRLKKVNYGTQKFRPVMDSGQIRISAENTIDNILGMSEQQITESLMGTFKSGGIGDPMNPRVLLVPDKWLYENKFLQGDLRKTIPSYMIKMGRLIETEKYFRSKGWSPEGGTSKMDFVASGIASDYKELLKQVDVRLDKKLSKAKTDKKKASAEKIASKERVKIRDRQKADTKLVDRMYRRVTGQQSQDNAEVVRAFRILNNHAYMSQLGLNLITCLNDCVTAPVRMGMIPYVRDAVIPFVRSLASAKNRQIFKYASRDMAVGIETEMAFNQLRFGSGLDTDLPANALERVSQQGANAMGLSNLSNPWTDTWRRIAFTGIQSNMYRRVVKFKNGKLKGSELAQFKVVGLNNIDMCNKIIGEFEGKKFGKKLSGAYVPNTHLWEDGEAAIAFRTAVKQELDSVLFSGKNIASYPDLLEYNGLSTSFLMYMGWGFTAFSNYTLPILQRVDFNKISGIGAMIAVSMMQDPLRILMKGEELTDEDLEPENLIKKGLLNSGVLGVFGETFNKVNAAFDIFPDLVVDKFSDKGKLELISNAPLSVLSLIGTIASLAVNQEPNKKDYKSIKRQIPLVEALFLKTIGNQMIDAMDIPETRAEAHKLKNIEEGIIEEKKPRKRKKRKE